MNLKIIKDKKAAGHVAQAMLSDPGHFVTGSISVDHEYIPEACVMDVVNSMACHIVELVERNADHNPLESSCSLFAHYQAGESGSGDAVVHFIARTLSRLTREELQQVKDRANVLLAELILADCTPQFCIKRIDEHNLRLTWLDAMGEGDEQPVAMNWKDPPYASSDPSRGDPQDCTVTVIGAPGPMMAMPADTGNDMPREVHIIHLGRRYAS